MKIDWIIKKDRYMYLLLPALIFLIYLNVVTEGLECNLYSWKQLQCPQNKNVNYLGKCLLDTDCEDICEIWSKTKYKNFDKEEFNEYKCEKGICTCKFLNSQGFEETCTEFTCPWV